jgi:enoyl-CoA hydratase/carnithine racemase
MTYRDIELRVDEGIGSITLRRPERRNALRLLTVSELCHALERCQCDESVSVVVLAAEGSSFCVGMDIQELAAAAGELDAGDVAPRTFIDLNLALSRLGKPAIASIQGLALGSGLSLVAGCPLALAADSAQFGAPEIKVGLWPMLSTPALIRAVGRRAALRLMLGGETVSAAEALRMGLISEIVSSVELAARTQALAAMLRQRSQVVMRLGLEAFEAIDGMEYERALDELDARFASVLSTEDAREGLRAFVEKREPVFRGC